MGFGTFSLLHFKGSRKEAYFRGCNDCSNAPNRLVPARYRRSSPVVAVSLSLPSIDEPIWLRGIQGGNADWHEAF